MKTNIFLASGAGASAYLTGHLAGFVFLGALALACLVIFAPGAITRWRIHQIEKASDDLELRQSQLEHRIGDVSDSDLDDEGRDLLASLRVQLADLERVVELLENKRYELEARLRPKSAASRGAGWPDNMA